MANQVWFGTGDLLEYVRPVAGDNRFDEPIRVRAVVLAFDVFVDGEIVVTVVEGAQSEFRDEEITETTIDVQTSDVYLERQLTRWDLEQLIGFDPEVIQRGNSVSELTNFTI